MIVNSIHIVKWERAVCIPIYIKISKDLHGELNLHLDLHNFSTLQPCIIKLLSVKNTSEPNVMWHKCHNSFCSKNTKLRFITIHTIDKPLRLRGTESTGVRESTQWRK